MSEALQTPQGDSSADLDAAIGAAAAPSGEAQAQNQAGGSKDELQAKREANALKVIQSKYDKIVNLVGNKLQGRWLQELGGDGIDRALHQFETLLRDPSVASAARRLAQNPDGSWTLTPAQRAAAAVDAGLDQDSGSSEFVEPWEKAIDQRLNPVLERMNALIERVQGVSEVNSNEAISRHTRKFLSDYPLNEEQRAEFSEKIGPAIARLDPQVVMKMTYDNFKSYLGIPNIEPYLEDVIARKQQMKRSAVNGMATDAPGLPSLGAETKPNAPVRPKSINQLQRELAAAAERAAREIG